MIGAAVLASPLTFIAPGGFCCRSEDCAVRPCSLKSSVTQAVLKPHPALLSLAPEQRPETQSRVWLGLLLRWWPLLGRCLSSTA